MDLRFGQLRGGSVTCEPLPIAASQTVTDQGGNFVYNNAGDATLCDDGSTAILGWAQMPAGALATGEYVNIVTDLTAVFRIAVAGGTYVDTMIGKTCDLELNANVQGAQLDASAEDTVMVVGGDLVNNAYVDVMINGAKQSATGVV